MTVLPSFRRFLRPLVFCAVAALVLFAAYFGLLRVSGNFNAVIAGEFYRSAQLDPRQLAHFALQHGIKTIVNLRGNNVGRQWYDAEIAQSQKLKIDHINFGLSAHRELTQERAAALIALLRTARKPILVHCEAGADRSGLVAALYLAVLKQTPPAVAQRQLSLRYGHFSLPFIREYAMDRSFEELHDNLTVSEIEAPFAVTR